ncbi:hypothetical protein C1645_845064 [Glomus cerebriforme]|uniref:Uncharacterized protein n=1 Tax=Glomus cerebriforme TaxID=658196 RepID=A0A397S4L9_9GLOM|nr:hypothetical protein C1645_845064 [Glomus cerebriforme]
MISDFGFCKPADESDKKKIYDSLGIIINEIISIIPPFNDESHDHYLALYLALDICRGKRPKIRDETPESIKELIQKCWDAIPENRPTYYEVFDKIHNYVYDYSEQIKELKELRYNFTPITKSTTKTQLYETHTQAIYKSRLLDLSNLPEPVNCSNQEGFISSGEGNIYTSEYLDCFIPDLSQLDFKSNDRPRAQ